MHYGVYKIKIYLSDMDNFCIFAPQKQGVVMWLYVLGIVYLLCSLYFAIHLGRKSNRAAGVFVFVLSIWITPLVARLFFKSADFL